MENKENLSADELYKLGNAYYKEKNYKKAIIFWKKSAIMGNSSAQSSLSFCDKTGTGVLKDKEKRDLSHYKIGNIFQNILKNKFISLKNNLFLFFIGLSLVGLKILIDFILRIFAINFSSKKFYIILLYNLFYTIIIAIIIFTAIKLIFKLYKKINISNFHYKRIRNLLYISILLIGLHFCIGLFYGIEVIATNFSISNTFLNSLNNKFAFLNSDFLYNSVENYRLFQLLILIIGTLLILILPIYLLLNNSKNKKIKKASIIFIIMTLFPIISLFIANNVSNSIKLNVYQLNYNNYLSSILKPIFIKGFPYLDCIYIGINIFIIKILNSIKNKIKNE